MRVKLTANPPIVLATTTSPSETEASVNEVAVVVFASVVGVAIVFDKNAAAEVGVPSCKLGVPYVHPVP